ncbi:phage integrase N-terminal SAM-like domain-containing protein [Xanthomonas phaseoli]|uniref:phage integrase N-terminal SAM-like domain-containing protein n=1 Tax=Xanthomonas phaseoli TaxID=1985254 RepID=UPI003B004BE6
MATRADARSPAHTALQPAHRAAYLGWIRRFILASGKRYPAQTGQMEVAVFLTRMAADAQVTTGIRNQAFDVAVVSLTRRIAYRSASRAPGNPSVENLE